mmetsp:Transcript_7327/g.20262  ORF Transcript_7327/g.20262 Transcript_7327/m.20262 type:complete len:279 (-) Transcript_7327:403-1239(-)
MPGGYWNGPGAGLRCSSRGSEDSFTSCCWAALSQLLRAGGGGGGGDDDDGVDETVVGVEAGSGVCPAGFAFADGDGVLGSTMASDRGRAGVGLDLVVVEMGEVMVPSRTCRVPPSTLIWRYPLLSLMLLISSLSLVMMLLSSSSDEEDAPSVSEKPSWLLSSSSSSEEEPSLPSSLNSSTVIMELVRWSIKILALSTDRAVGWSVWLIVVDVSSLVGVDEAKSVAAAVMGEGPPAASAPLLALGVVGVMIAMYEDDESKMKVGMPAQNEMELLPLDIN